MNKGKIISLLFVFITQFMLFQSLVLANAKTIEQIEKMVEDGKAIKVTKDNLEQLSYFKIDWKSGSSIQGGTLTPNYVIFAQQHYFMENDSNRYTGIYLIDRNTLEFVDNQINPSAFFDFYHANDIAYNSSTDELIIPYCEYAENSSKCNKNSKAYLGAFSLEKLTKYSSGHLNLEELTVESIPVDIQYSLIVYDSTKNRLLGLSESNDKFKINELVKSNDNTYTSNYLFDTDRIIKSVSASYYYDGDIYIGLWEQDSESTPEILSSGKKNLNCSTVIEVVSSIDGSLKNVIYIPNTELPGEIEHLFITESGEIIFGFAPTFKPDKNFGFASSDISADNINNWSNFAYYKIKNKPVDLIYKVNITSNGKIDNGMYKFKLIDSKGNIVQEKSNVGNEVVFDAIATQEVGIHKYKIVDLDTNKEYSVSSTVTGNPQELKYVELTTYDGDDSLTIEKKYVESENTGKNNYLFLVGIMSVIIGVCIITKKNKKIMNFKK